jgi:hypothetical protein
MENTQNKNLNPYEFTLEINGEPNAIRVELPKPGDYIVYINGERTGHIYPETSNTILVWQTKDNIQQELVDEIGKHIEALESDHI